MPVALKWMVINLVLVNFTRSGAQRRFFYLKFVVIAIPFCITTFWGGDSIIDLEADAVTCTVRRHSSDASLTSSIERFTMKFIIRWLFTFLALPEKTSPWFYLSRAFVFGKSLSFTIHLTSPSDLDAMEFSRNVNLLRKLNSRANRLGWPLGMTLPALLRSISAYKKFIWLNQNRQ